MNVSSQRQPPNIVATAERILTECFGSTVHLQSQENLGGSERSRVVRCLVLGGPVGVPDSVVLKQAAVEPEKTFDPTERDGAAWRLFNDWAGLQFLSQVSNGDSPTPRFYGGDQRLGLIVIEDLGTGKRLDHLLLGQDAQAAQAGLVKLASELGRMHALSVGKRREYNQLRKVLGPIRRRNSQAVEHRRWVTQFQAACDAVGLQPHSSFREELSAVAAFIAQPGAFDAYTHGDPCPDNVLLTPAGLQLLDFEFGAFRHALTDGVYGRIHFPTCWCVNRIPEPVILDMERAYRGELVKGCPEAGDDGLFHQAVVEACVHWHREMFGFVAHHLHHDDWQWGISSMRQRVLVRLHILVKTTETFGYLEAVGATARDMAKKLESIWSQEASSMPYYPAMC